MTSQIKPIKLWAQGGERAPGLNPGKVAIVLQELGLPYEEIPFPLSDIKTPEYLAINPNGRLPAIHDPNTNITVWESGAIIEYIIELYDKAHLLSFTPGTPEYFHAKQWLHFQMSGQGPYYGQAAWFRLFSPSPNPAASERYSKEVQRVCGVLESHLSSQKVQYARSANFTGPWLVGNKFSYADIAFIMWQNVVAHVLPKEDYDVDEFPLVKEWVGKMSAKEGVKKALHQA